MAKLAKTYHNINQFQGPSNLSDFGIPIPENNPVATLGLEEFNFCDILLSNKLMYLPAYSHGQNYNGDEVKLFYLNQQVNPKQTYHYATIRGVERIENNVGIIGQIRQQLIEEGFPIYVQNNQHFQHLFAENFLEAFEMWMRYFNSSVITAFQHDFRFVVNVRYNEIEIFDQPQPKNWNNFIRASVLFDDPEDALGLLNEI
jgi:hypothetical protein